MNLTYKYPKCGEVGGPKEIGGKWHFFSPPNLGTDKYQGPPMPTPSITITEKEWNQIGRPSVLNVIIAAGS